MEKTNNIIQADNGDRVEAIKEKLRAVLADHKVKTADIQAVSGPSVTTYKVYPAKGVSCAKIKRLQDEIELSLDAGGVRVVTLPDSVGIEVANEHPSIVPLKPLLGSDEFKNSDAALPVAAGCDTEGRPCIIDLAEAPHILMAGATKQGKTTAVHSLILSLLRSRMPEEVRFALIDPKGCELKAYKSLSSNYILAASDAANGIVITTLADAETLLRELCEEMESRRETLVSAGAADIRELHDSGKAMPHIVVIIDEFADLTAPTWIDRKTDKLPDEIMGHMVHLAQNGGAAGIHLVITTQSVSPRVITGIIKASFPTRMAFRVFSKAESKIILDVPGAERLIGSGDMLLECGDKITWVQGAYSGREEIYDIIGSDPLFDEACRIVQERQLVSASMLQLKLGIGYHRAAKLKEALDEAGIVKSEE